MTDRAAAPIGGRDARASTRYLPALCLSPAPRCATARAGSQRALTRRVLHTNFAQWTWAQRRTFLQVRSPPKYSAPLHTCRAPARAVLNATHSYALLCTRRLL